MGEVERHRHAGLCWVAITSTIKKLYETKQNKTKKQTPQKIKKKKKNPNLIVYTFLHLQYPFTTRSRLLTSPMLSCTHHLYKRETLLCSLKKKLPIYIQMVAVNTALQARR